MRISIIAVAFVILMTATSRIEAGPPHGGGHGGSAPRPPHFNPPPAPHFSQPAPAHVNSGHANATPHANAINQGGFGSGYSSTGYYTPRHSTTNGTRTTTRLHKLSNALQDSHASNKTASATHSAGHSPKALNTAEAETPTAAVSSNTATNVSSSPGSSTPVATANMPATRGQTAITHSFSLSTAGTGGTPATSAGQSSIKSTFSLANGGTSATPATPAGRSVIKSTIPLSSTGTTGTPAGQALSMTKTGHNLPATLGTSAVTPLGTSTAPTAPVSATHTNGYTLGRNSAYFSLMSELYGPYGLPHYSPINYGRNRYFGSRYYGNRSYGDRNNSMYFAQMRRLSRLANDLNMLGRGATAGVSSPMTSRIRGDLIGVVFGNGSPPYPMVHQLSTDLVVHLPNRTTPMFNSGQLARDLMVVMNGSGENMAQLESAIGSAHSVLNMSGVHAQGIQTIVNDMGMVATWGNGFMR
jgi:hypothetical protein